MGVNSGYPSVSLVSLAKTTERSRDVQCSRAAPPFCSSSISSNLEHWEIGRENSIENITSLKHGRPEITVSHSYFFRPESKEANSLVKVFVCVYEKDILK